jgi:hypothetical protein
MNMITLNKFLLITIITLLSLPDYTTAQEKTNKDLEKAIQNPIANIVSLPFQNNTDFGIGEYDRTKNTLNIQPVLPFGLGKSVNLIARTIIPVISQPIGESETTTGLGDIALSMFFTAANPGKLIWGIGPAFGFPTATDDVLGTSKWTVGPSVLVIIQPEGWTVGTLLQNTWSYAGDENRGDVNLFYSQIFIVKNLPNGWYLNTAPIITANWNASTGNKWTVPIGIGGGKLIRAGKLPINIQVGYYNYVVKPDGGPKWQLRTQIQFILPKFY